MAQPPLYTPTTVFADYQSAHTSAPFSGALLDTELNNIRTSLNAVIANTEILQRDDTALANASVHPDSLTAATKTLMAGTGTAAWLPRGLWLTATSYAVKDVVEQSSVSYVCAVAHTSGTFNTDHTAGKWVAISPTVTSAVTSFNSRTGDVTLTQADAFTALGYVPVDPSATTIYNVVQRGVAAVDDADFVIKSQVPIWTTGDVKLTMKQSVDTGWVFCTDGTIGDALSGATIRANADTADLFALLWNNVGTVYAPLYLADGSGTTYGANAAADFAAHRRIALTKMLGRSLAVAGIGSGLSVRVLGQTTGAETHALTAAELPGAGTAGSAAGVNQAGAASAGAATAHSIMQPTTFLNVMIKL